MRFSRINVKLFRVNLVPWPLHSRPFTQTSRDSQRSSANLLKLLPTQSICSTMLPFDLSHLDDLNGPLHWPSVAYQKRQRQVVYDNRLITGCSFCFWSSSLICSQTVRWWAGGSWSVEWFHWIPLDSIGFHRNPCDWWITGSEENPTEFLWMPFEDPQLCAHLRSARSACKTDSKVSLVPGKLFIPNLSAKNNSSRQGCKPGVGNYSLLLLICFTALLSDNPLEISSRESTV